MFTGMLQNLLNSSGHSVAIERANQLKSYVKAHQADNINAVKKAEVKQVQSDKKINDNPIDNPELNTFEDVMKSSLNVHTRFNVNKPDYKVKFGSLTTHAQALNAVNQLSQAQAASSIAPISEKTQIRDLIDKISKKHGVDEKLIHAIIKQESGYNPNAKSSAGAQGLMQLMPSTAKSLGVTDPYNPVQNIDGGVRYLKSMLDRYNGSIPLALAAYNAGPGNVDKYDNIPPFKETQNYVRNILADYL